MRLRALLFDAHGRAVDGVLAQERYSVRSTEEGASEDDPDTALERVWRCVDAALEQAGPLAAAIGAVALDTLVTNSLAIDGADRPLTALMTYADTRPAADAAQLRGHVVGIHYGRRPDGPRMMIPARYGLELIARNL